MYSDKYCPTDLDDLTYNPDITQWLREVPFDNNFLFFGKSGKKTRALCMLAKFYGTHEFFPKIHKDIVNKSCEFYYKSTNHHIEICPADYASNDKHIIHEFIEPLAETRNIINNEFRIFVIEKVDYLSSIALLMLKGIIERGNARFILLAKNIQCIPATICNLCYNIRIAAPRYADVCAILTAIAVKEELHDYKRAIKKIVDTHREPYDLKAIINQLQLSYVGGKYTAYEDPVQTKLRKVCEILAKNFDFKYLDTVRKLLYENYTASVECTTMIQYILIYFINIVRDPGTLALKAAEIQGQMMNSFRDLLFVEAFIYQVLQQIYDA